MKFDFNIPTKVHMETLTNFTSFLINEITGKSVVIVISQSMVERFDLQDDLSRFREHNRVLHIQEVPVNPTESDILHSISQIPHEYDTMVAIGGGSAIDLAKAIIAFEYLRQSEATDNLILESIIGRKYLEHEHKVNFIAIPTTAGTGSEVTSWATIWSSHEIRKMSLEASWLIPDIAIIIPEFTVKMPERLTLSTGLDALCHAAESYWSKQGNEISRELSKTAISMAMEYLPKVLEEPENILYRKKMCLSSLFAGLAFANTRTTACHAISYPLTSAYGVEHGFACVLTLVEVMKLNEDSIIEWEELLIAFGVDSVEELAEWLNQICDKIQKLQLSEFGIPKEDIPKIMEHCFTAGRIDNNPKECEQEDILLILQRCY